MTMTDPHNSPLSARHTHHHKYPQSLTTHPSPPAAPQDPPNIHSFPLLLPPSTQLHHTHSPPPLPPTHPSSGIPLADSSAIALLSVGRALPPLEPSKQKPERERECAPPTADVLSIRLPHIVSHVNSNSNVCSKATRLTLT
jgi:hypothetical protein